ncbi:hypothetical protein FB451DRAFT_1022046 [Mycena latifolia]|nr:hypothetical protein FB451DRAFT_1022046 [Mycena latifolia]
MTSPFLPASRILFYNRDDPYYGFTNFSPHPVEYKGKSYPTSEHLFQAFKFMEKRPDIAEKLRTISKFPRDVFQEAHKQHAHVRSDWKDVKIAMMDIAVGLKFSQHKELRDELLSTGEAELVEDSAEDAFWGIGKNGDGRNELGKALQRLRTKLRLANQRSEHHRILFHDRNDPYYSFTNVSAHPVAYNGEVYPTSEHLFQAFKFLEHHPHIAKTIRLAKKPSDAWAEVSRNRAKIRADWPNIRITVMDKAPGSSHRFNQFPLLKQELLATGDAQLVEDSSDAFWGRGEDHRGRNELGKALERLRTKLLKLD